MMELTRTREHAWLQKLVGEWKGEGEGTAGPDQPPMKWTVDETVRGIGDVWIQAESSGIMPDGGGPSTMIITLGYDPHKKRFSGTFIGSMMTHLWIYEGDLDAAGKVLTLNAEGPGMMGPGMVKYQDIVEIISDDHRTLSSQMQMPEGTWNKFMTVHYRRKK
jgi:hypothetical protein